MNRNLKSPGVYVFEEKATPAIAGVGTSTAGFIGILESTESGSVTQPEKKSAEEADINTPQRKAPVTLKFSGADVTSSPNGQQANFSFDIPEDFGHDVDAYKFYAQNSSAPSSAPTELTVADNGLTLDIAKKTATVKFSAGVSGGQVILAAYTLEKSEEEGVPPTTPETQKTVGVTSDSEALATKAEEVILCTNFTEFKRAFYTKSQEEEGKPTVMSGGLSNLTYAVYGFFANGGTRCYAAYTTINDAANILEQFAAIDEIAIVAAPGANATIQNKLIEHCQETQDRFAILDSPADATNDTMTKSLNASDDGNKNGTPKTSGGLPPRSPYAALYYPWLVVSDLTNSDQTKTVPPSGYIAGIYARVDAQRGVHKAPANEVVFGATGLQRTISRNKQDGFNPAGVNCIRNLNGNIRVWGARTWDPDSDTPYISTRRLLNYIRESIDEGTQWAVFEPNSPELWAKVRREVTAFLTTVWRSGALFGATPQEAFFVQCDEETNPPEERVLGQLSAKVGVAIVKPAEFVIFELSQWNGGN